MMELKNHIKFTTKQVLFILNNIESMPTKEIAHRLGLKQKQIRSIYRKYGIKLCEDGCFKRGHRTWNKGKKGLQFSPQTQFKKGIRPHNTKAIGAKRITKDGYYEIKITEHKWLSLHRFEWEKIHGAMPDGHIIIFRKGADKLNFKITDLECITRAENARRNHNRKKAAAAMKVIWMQKKDIDSSNAEKLMFG